MIKLIAVLFFVASLHVGSAFAEEDNRYYLFIGEPSPQAWQWLMKNSSDRESVARVGIEKLGGELLSYYWGVNNAKNYITVRLPADNDTVPALLISRLSTGLLISYEAIELMPSSEMPSVMQRIDEIAKVDDVQPGKQDTTQ
jgi:hypothetical protein